MFIAVPASAYGGPSAASVLDLEPLLGFARRCRPDAVSLMPPPGPDDLPNGAALLAMRDLLEREGLRVTAGCWKIPPDADPADPAWQLQSLFEARALIGALGEAGVDPLIVDWPFAPSPARGESVLAHYLERLLEEADRARVRLALRSALSAAARLDLLVRLSSPWLGLCAELSELTRERVERETARLYVATLRGDAVVEAAPILRLLDRSNWDGELLLHGCDSPLDYALGLGFYRGALATG